MIKYISKKIWKISNITNCRSKGPRAQTSSPESEIAYWPGDADRIFFGHKLYNAEYIDDVPKHTYKLLSNGAAQLSDVACCCGLSNGYIISERLKNFLTEHHPGHCHFYTCDVLLDNMQTDKVFFIMQVANRISSINHELSKVDMFGKGWSYIENNPFVIDLDRVDPKLSFWRDDDTGIVVARDSFKNAFQKNKMTGLTFFPLLSEMPPELAQERLEENARRRSGYYLKQDGGTTNS